MRRVEKEVTAGRWKGALAKVGGELRYCDIMGAGGKAKGRGILSDRCHRGDKKMGRGQERLWEFTNEEVIGAHQREVFQASSGDKDREAEILA